MGESHFPQPLLVHIFMTMTSIQNFSFAEFLILKAI
jgi:hypothetical protein